MSTTEELVEIIVELKMQLVRKNEIIHNLQDYIQKKSLNSEENKIDMSEYDELYAEFVALQDEVEELRARVHEESKEADPMPTHKVVFPKYKVGAGAVPKWGLVDYEYDTGHVVPRDDSHNWG